MSKKKNSYATDPLWSDVTPIPQDDGGPNALATIAYTDEYREASSYLRAIMTANEQSERALALTAHLIDLNPAHYTVWLYRAQLLEALNKPLRPEFEWLNDTSLKHIKNYQIWHHRQLMLERFAAQQPALFPPARAPDDNNPIAEELEFLAAMLDRDTKNYHVWSYRHWLVRRFALWDGYGELDECERLLRLDVRNNSVWNHRWFVVFGRETDGMPLPAGAWQREVTFAQEAIRLAPQNESSWNYLRGLLRKAKMPRSEMRVFAKEFTGDLADESAVRSTFALDLLADACAEDDERKPDADKALKLLAERFDPIRENYWNYKRKALGLIPA